jgi:hypothetical protein
MARPWVEIGLRVIMRALILVLDEKSNGCSEGNIVFNAGLQVDKVLLVSLKTIDKGLSQKPRVLRALTGVVRLLCPGLLRLSCV